MPRSHWRTERRACSNAGFTLAEMLVVVLVTGILAAIAIPVFTSQKARAHDAAVEAQISTVVKSVESLMASSPVTPIFAVAGDVRTAVEAERTPTTDGIVWDVYGSTRGYCVQAWHPSSHTYTEFAPLAYDSTQGGMRPPGQRCSPMPPAPDGTVMSAAGFAAAGTTYAWTATPHASTSTATTASGTRTNHMRNPSLESTGTPIGFGGAGGTATSAYRVTGDAPAGSSFARARWTSTLTTSSATDTPHFNSGSQLAVVTPELPYTASAWVRCTKAVTFRPAIVMHTSSGGAGWSERAGPSVAGPANVWTRVGFTRTPGTGQGWARMVVRMTEPASWVAGDMCDIDGILIEQADRVLPYFDGDTVSTQ